MTGCPARRKTISHEGFIQRARPLAPSAIKRLAPQAFWARPITGRPLRPGTWSCRAGCIRKAPKMKEPGLGAGTGSGGWGGTQVRVQDPLRSHVGRALNAQRRSHNFGPAGCDKVRALAARHQDSRRSSTITSKPPPSRFRARTRPPSPSTLRLTIHSPSP